MAVRKQVRKGNLLENGLSPRMNDAVWALVGMINPKPVKGTIVNTFNIDNRGLGNTYVDVKTADEKQYHLPVNVLFDHKPKLEKVTDCYGDTTKWL